MELVRRFFDQPKQSYFLFGPRGTGKSTWMREVNRSALTLDLLDPETERVLRARPESLEERIDGATNRTIILDEVQKVPELLPVVHRLIEQKRGLFFVMSGSSARKLRRAGTDLLAGRALTMSFHPFMASELGGVFDLPSALRIGMLPVVLFAPDPELTLRSYVGLYLREEVQAEGLTRNLGDFSRFLETMSFSHGSVLNMTNVARDASVERRTAAGYLGILEDLMLGTTIPVFTRRAKRAVIAHPK
ncbi:MAG: AAA family ATPase, partial [Candidatus Peribacteraceae bacterium]|nr:AAA family ATPase [Candidatus Peribacteraceae bacterium]